MRRRILALALSLSALLVLAPSAGALPVEVDDRDDGPYVCIRSALLLGDPICIEIYPGA